MTTLSKWEASPDADDATKSNQVIGLSEASHNKLPTKTAALALPCADGG